ncbi:11981_t:CDS:2 [Funneliformis geosporum]|nr:11981_t:CDS:2 [Funneliformis geosporum]
MLYPNEEYGVLGCACWSLKFSDLSAEGNKIDFSKDAPSWRNAIGGLNLEDIVKKARIAKPTANPDTSLPKPADLSTPNGNTREEGEDPVEKVVVGKSLKLVDTPHLVIWSSCLGTVFLLK